MEKQFFYTKSSLIGDSQEGPVTLSQLAMLWYRGKVKPKTLVCQVGTQNWVELQSIPEVLQRRNQIAKQEEQKKQAEERERENQRQQEAETQRKAQEAEAMRQREAQRQAQIAQNLARSTSPPAAPGINRPKGTTATRKKGSYLTFDRFVTPTYIKSLWIIANVLAVLSFIGWCIYLLVIFTGTLGLGMSLGGEETAGLAVGVIFFAVIGTIFMLFGIILWLLLVRVGLECVMVAFRSSRSLDILAGLEPPFDDF